MTMDQMIKHKIYLNLLAITRRSMPGSLVQDSFLQLEIPLANNTNVYKFGVNSTDTRPPQRASETRLNNNDAFCITQIGLYIKNEDPAKPGSGTLQSYPNISVFPDEALNLANADLEAVFNSQLSIKVGDTVFANGIDMRPTRTVRTTQQTSATNESEQLGDDGQIPNEPVMTLDGSKKNDVAVTIANWAGQLIQYSAGHGTNVYLVLKFWGFLITNGSGLGLLNYQ